MGNSTRVHGAIDYSVAATLAGLAATRLLPRPVRAVLGSAGTLHAGYAVPRTTPGWRATADLDAPASRAGHARRVRAVRRGAGTAGARLVARPAVRHRRGGTSGGVRQPQHAGQRAGPGLWAARPPAGFDRPAVPGVGYPPLDTLKHVAEDIFIVDSLLPGALGHLLPVRMTVVRLHGGDLLLHSRRSSPGA